MQRIIVGLVSICLLALAAPQPATAQQVRVRADWRVSDRVGVSLRLGQPHYYYARPYYRSHRRVIVVDRYRTDRGLHRGHYRGRGHGRYHRALERDHDRYHDTLDRDHRRPHRERDGRHDRGHRR